MALTLRSGTPADAIACGTICYQAFSTLNAVHNFPPDFPNPEVAIGLMHFMLARPDVFSVVAEDDGRIIGSNFLWEDAVIFGVGPITVDPTAQNKSVGRQLMDRVLQRTRERNAPGVRLVQAAFHCRSMSLYTKLGFDVKEPLVTMQGAPPRMSIPGRAVRPATRSDLAACAQLCERIHGFARTEALAGGIAQGDAMVVEHHGRITGYATQIGFFGHAVGEANDDLKALIGAAKEIAGPGLLLPTRNSDLFRWCLNHGLRVTQPMTLMAIGLYNQPKGAFLPSILY